MESNLSDRVQELQYGSILPSLPFWMDSLWMQEQGTQRRIPPHAYMSRNILSRIQPHPFHREHLPNLHPSPWPNLHPSLWPNLVPHLQFSRQLNSSRQAVSKCTLNTRVPRPGPS